MRENGERKKETPIETFSFCILESTDFIRKKILNECLI